MNAPRASPPPVPPALRSALRRVAVALDRAHEAAGTTEAARCAHPLVVLHDEHLQIIDTFERGGRRFVLAAEGGVRLRAREREVLALAAAGRSNKAIAYALQIGTGAVAAYLSSALAKLGLRSRRELVRFLR